MRFQGKIAVLGLGVSLGAASLPSAQAQIDDDLPSRPTPVETVPSVIPKPAPTAAPKIVYLPGDELILPPLLHRFEGGDILNVTSLQHRKRSAKTGEWLEFGDSFSLPSRLSLQVILRETLQWVGGGVFQAKIGEKTWDEAHTPYVMTIDHGWLRVWAKPDSTGHGIDNSIRITTTNMTFKTKDAEFWLNTRSARTEMYLVSGEVTDSTGKTYREKKFYLWEGEPSALKFSSKEWDAEALEVQIAGIYPSFVKLADRAESDWKSGETEDAYASLRRKGWRKFDRHEPDPSVFSKKKQK